VVQYGPYVLDDEIPGTTHGSPYDYDRRVPLLIRAPGVGAGTVDQQVRTVDVAPTVASLLGLAPPAELDGNDLSLLLRPEGAGGEATSGSPAPR